MKRFTLLLVAFAGLSAVATDSVSWEGDALADWLHIRPLQCREVRVESGLLKGSVTGRDSQLYARVDLYPHANHVVYIKMRAPLGGRCQLFWVREGDGTASEARQKAFDIAGGDAWREYRIRPGWSGAVVKTLRLDLPEGFANGTPFEIAGIRVVREGEELSVDTARTMGVAFDLQMPAGQHYCTLVWEGDKGAGEFGFTPATDGLNHRYWFDLRGCRIHGWGPRANTPCWKGTVKRFAAEQARHERELPIRRVEFLRQAPDTQSDPAVLSVRASEAVPRTGRPFVVEAVVRNLGTRPATNLEFSFDGLPRGVAVLDAAELRPADALPGSRGGDSIWGDMRPALTNECVYHIQLSDLGVGRHRFGVSLSADGVAPRRTELCATVLPSLNLAAADYPPEPKPVSTAPYEIGAFLFPGWTAHRWHAIWGHAPWRKPVLGWYDEEKPETIDWQIKHLAENGVSFVFVDWYWMRGHQHLNHWMKSFKEAKYRRFLKWSLMWANHTGPGTHSIEDQENVTRYWIENFFRDPQYQKVNGQPVVSIWAASNMNRDVKDGGCRRLLDVSRRIAREAGFAGIWFVAVRGDDESPAYHKDYLNCGFDATCNYRYLGGVPGRPHGPGGSRPYSWIAETSLRHWRTLKKASRLPFLPSMSTAWDDRPWRGETGWEVTNVNAGDFRRICSDARAYSDETGDRLLLMGPLDEWGEGSIGYPNAELGFGMLESVREVFGRKPSGGWPVNHAPEDVGLVCPQR